KLLINLYIICFSPFLLPLTFLTGKKIIFASTDFFEGETYQQKMKRIIYKLIKSLFIPKCSAVIATTNYTRKSFLGLVKKEKLFLIRNAIYVKDFKPKLRKNLNKIPILYYHGKIRDDYNVDLLINCLNYIDEKVELWLVGGGNALNRLKNISKKSRQKVKFFGIVPYERIPKIIKKADICLHPLPAFATKLWEYLAAGKPVVAVEGHKIKELIRNKVHAILTKDDPKDFAEGIKLLLHDKKLRMKLIKNGLKLVKRLDYSIITKQYEKLLDRL
ncbi:MAG: glycosyltransferase family 4 protein, partial [Candidatus Aenigmatarchaeota archaeon]